MALLGMPAITDIQFYSINGKDQRKLPETEGRIPVP